MLAYQAAQNKRNSRMQRFKTDKRGQQEPALGTGGNRKKKMRIKKNKIKKTYICSSICPGPKSQQTCLLIPGKVTDVEEA